MNMHNIICNVMLLQTPKLLLLLAVPHVQLHGVLLLSTAIIVVSLIIGNVKVIQFKFSIIKLEYSCNKYCDLIGHSEVSISHRDLQDFS